MQFFQLVTKQTSDVFFLQHLCHTHKHDHVFILTAMPCSRIWQLDWSPVTSVWSSMPVHRWDEFCYANLMHINKTLVSYSYVSIDSNQKYLGGKTVLKVKSCLLFNSVCVSYCLRVCTYSWQDSLHNTWPSSWCASCPATWLTLGRPGSCSSPKPLQFWMKLSSCPPAWSPTWYQCLTSDSK